VFSLAVFRDFYFFALQLASNPSSAKSWKTKIEAKKEGGLESQALFHAVNIPPVAQTAKPWGHAEQVSACAAWACGFGVPLTNFFAPHNEASAIECWLCVFFIRFKR
jgi:hypothetical protein